MFPIFFEKHPKVHVVFLISILIGVVIAWSAFILPFHVYDELVDKSHSYRQKIVSLYTTFVDDFRPYYQKVVDLIKKDKK